MLGSQSEYWLSGNLNELVYKGQKKEKRKRRIDIYILGVIQNGLLTFRHGQQGLMDLLNCEPDVRYKVLLGS